MNKHSICKYLLIALLTSSSCAAWSSDAKPSVESFFGDPDIRSAVISPKGSYVAILGKAPDGGQILVVRDTTNPKNFTVPAAAKADEITAVHWINEDRIGFTIKNMDLKVGGNWDEYAASRDGSNLTHLISGSWLHHQQNTGSTINDKVLTAEYTYFGSLHDGSDDIIVMKHIFNNVDRYAENTHLFRLNTVTRKLSEYQEGKLPEKVYGWLRYANDVPRIALSKSAGKCIVSYLAPGKAEWIEINNIDCFHNKNFTPLFFDGTDTLVVSSAYKGHSALFRYDLNKLQRENEPFLTIDGFDFRGAPIIDRATNKMIGIHFLSDAWSTAWFDPRIKEVQKKIDGMLTSTVNTIHCATDCLAAPAVLVTASSDRQPTQYFIFTPASGTMIGLGSTHPEIKATQMGTRDFHRYRARDGLLIPIYVTLPPGKAIGPIPTVVLVHGGPSARGSSWEWEDQAQFLASRGYVVLQPEFRGSTGFGYAHFQAGWKQWGRAMQDDLVDAVNWSVEKGWSDPKRVAIMGASYGGYATLIGLIKNPEIFRCGVEWAGVTDVDMMFNTAEDDATQEWLHYDMKILIGDPVADAAMFHENSPLENAAKLTQPLLIAHGTNDVRVPIVHATKFLDAVRLTNNRVVWIVYQDEGHGWHFEKDNIDFWTHVESFLDKNLKTID